MHNPKIINVLTPKNDEVATKKYVDTKTSSIHQSEFSNGNNSEYE